ncbi:MAG: xylulokinase [Sulfobacillus acidophilus]|uniref:Xylulose kinase n=1 Tax=Sulfobacillus acidophilus TaxID=53633 RepID=A0A2T2WKE6_9FIRM|nr:MAG: xylulokinase [Sulfobacillus acidophilus]
MATIDAYLGLDLGTQGLKALAITDDGRVLWRTRVAYPTQYLHEGWEEQSPGDWQDAVNQVLAHAASLPYKWRALGISGQMHTTVMCNGEGQALRNAILWSDRRSDQVVNDVKKKFGVDYLRSLVGNVPLTNFSLMHLLWVRQYESERYREIRHVAIAKDWIRWWLTGEWNIDPTDASGTYLLDVENRTWSTDLARDLEVDLSWWGSLRNSHEWGGVLIRGPEKLRGLPVVVGAGDQAASAVGTGLSTGELGLSLGSSGVLFWLINPFSIPKNNSVHVFCHALNGMWHWMTVTQSAATAYKWMQEQFYPNSTYQDVDADVARVALGAEGVIFWPYLSGERSPILEPKAWSGFVGLTASHGRQVLARAVMEGVTFSLKHCWDAMNSEETIVPQQIVLTGGGSKSSIWNQIVADVLNMPIMIITDDGAAAGAAWLARCAFENEWTQYPRHVVSEVVPQARNVRQYREIYDQYRDIVSHLEPLWAYL